MSNDLYSSDVDTQIKSFQASDEARQRLLAGMLAGYTALAKKHENLKNDYASEREVRRSYQCMADSAQQEVAEVRRGLEDSSFVLALIDGDGVIFQDTLLTAAANEGGSEAASRLQHAIREHITSLYDSSGNWPILVQIYLSLDKLAHKLATVEVIGRPTDLRTFAQRFSVNQALFTIVDVGHGKERADYKIKEMLRTFSDNPTCRHIVFGGCHDAGYLLSLDQYKHDAAKAAHITLLESTPAGKEFQHLPNFRRARFDNVFRSTGLPEYRRKTQSHTPVQLPLQTFTQPPLTSPHQSTRKATNSPPLRFDNGPSGLQASLNGSSTLSSLAEVDPKLRSSSWATVGKNGVLPNESISIARGTI